MKTIIAISFILLPFFALAQFERGQVYLGGSLSTSLVTTSYPPSPINSTTNTINNQFSVSPSIGFFLNPKFSVGSAIGYSTSLTSYSVFTNQNGTIQTETERTQNFYFNPFVRYYIPITSSFFIALQGQLSFNRGTTTNFNPVTYSQTDAMPSYSIGAYLSPFFIFFPSFKWGIEAGIGSIGYSYARSLPNVSSTNTFVFSSGTFSFGLAYYFSRKPAS